MEDTQKQFIDIFKHNLKKEAYTLSVATLLSDRYIKRIKHNPYYQRNYVWEKDKQSFFVESVILGTEIPPLIFYKSGMTMELIDGRQRFETLKRFKEGDFALNSSGLLELQALVKKTFNLLNPDVQQVFLNTKIRVFEFEVVGMPDLDPMIEDKIKKEIFRRYNSGITPLTQSEVDNAKYDSDELSDYFKEILKENNTLFNIINERFFNQSAKSKNDLLVDMVTFLRKMMIIDSIPISRYADSGKTLIIDLLYDNLLGQIQENNDNYNDGFKLQANILFDQITSIFNVLKIESRNVNECLLWGIRVLSKERITLNFEDYKKSINEHYTKNIEIYDIENYHYYGNIIARFEDTGIFLQKITGFNFKLYIRTPEFKDKLRSLKQTDKDAELTIEKLSDLRINKPAPASKPIFQILEEVQSNYYLIRPSYQRQEKINERKASSIIESLLLGIKLPPLFIYLRKDGVREVIDGQQRLLSIIGFLGKSYKNEEGKITHSKNNSFVLRDLRILFDYNGKRYTDLINEIEDKILDFNIDEIEISEDLNEGFEPTDLFIRLNSKPYPIKSNTFEMWNSTVDKEVVQLIKDVTNEYISWFYIKAPEGEDIYNRNDRMQNEELITILSYLCYNSLIGESITKILGFYPRLEQFTCRLKTKSNLTEILENFEFKPTEKEIFIKSIHKTSSIIKIIRDVLLGGNATKESFNSILNIKQHTRFSRSNQELYIIWILLDNITIEQAKTHRKDLLNNINTMLSLLKNINDVMVDEEYVVKFHTQLENIKSAQSSY